MVNQAGIDLIKHYEGWSSTPYKCPAGIWTIGYGSTWDTNGDPVTEQHHKITKELGETLLRREVILSERAVLKLTRVPLTDNQLSALVSLVYNIGSGNFQSSSIRMRLNRGDYRGAAGLFWQWRRGGGVILKGLVQRREQERQLFLS